MSSQNNIALVSYVPSPHRGYVDFFRSHTGAELFIFGQSFIDEYSSLTRNLPGNNPEDVRRMVESLDIFSAVHILEKNDTEKLKRFSSIVMPDEEVSRAAAQFFPKNISITFDATWRLRWHWDSVNKKEDITTARVVSFETFDQECMLAAEEASRKSPDWWRQVGAVLVKEGKVLLSASNIHVPSEQTLYHYGDPRSSFEAGASIEVSSALHAEMGLLSEAAKKGISTEGADLYVTTFPCPPCAYACANSGIKRLFFRDGYSLLEGERAFIAKDVDLVQVIFEEK